MHRFDFYVIVPKVRISSFVKHSIKNESHAFSYASLRNSNSFCEKNSYNELSMNVYLQFVDEVKPDFFC